MSNAIATEAQEIVRRAAAPVRPGDTVKAQIARAWAELGRPPFWRVRAAWYADAGCWSAAAIRDLQGRYLAMKARRAASTRAADLTQAARLDAAAGALETIDADFHRNEIDRLRLLARELRAVGAHRPLAEEPG